MNGGKVMSKLTAKELENKTKRLERTYDSETQPRPARDDRWARRLVSLHEIAEIGGVTLRRFDRLTNSDREWLGLEAAT